MANFPTLSKKQDSKYFSVTSEDPAMRTEMEGGYVATRPRHTRAPRQTYTTGFTDISEVDRLALKAFWDARHGGSESFVWTNPVTTVATTVRFSGPLDFKYKGFGGNHRWDITNIKLEDV